MILLQQCVSIGADAQMLYRADTPSNSIEGPDAVIR